MILLLVQLRRGNIFLMNGRLHQVHIQCLLSYWAWLSVWLHRYQGTQYFYLCKSAIVYFLWEEAIVVSEVRLFSSSSALSFDILRFKQFSVFTSVTFERADQLLHSRPFSSLSLHNPSCGLFAPTSGFSSHLSLSPCLHQALVFPRVLLLPILTTPPFLNCVPAHLYSSSHLVNSYSPLHRLSSLPLSFPLAVRNMSDTSVLVCPT